MKAEMRDEDAGGTRWLVLGLLVLGYMLNFVDRQIVGVLATAIKTDLGLSDTQLGLLGGTAFAILYTFLGIPVAAFADRLNRVRIVACAIAIWSLFTALCGFAQSFLQLFLARLGVGMGEAGGVAPSHSLISDYFPERMRATALGVFSLGVPIGSAMGIYFGGWIAVALDWRWAFLLAGLPGIPLALIIAAAIREPIRGRLDIAPRNAVPDVKIKKSQAWMKVAAMPGFWLLSLGAAAVAIPFNGIMFWMPSLLQREYGLSATELPGFYASIVLIGGSAGLWIGGWLGDKLEHRFRGASILASGILVLLATPTCLAGLWAGPHGITWLMFALTQALAISYVGPILAALHRIAGPSLRATASACYLFVSNIAGLGLGSLVIGLISDEMLKQHTANALGQAMAITSILFTVGAALFLLAGRRMREHS